MSWARVGRVALWVIGIAVVLLIAAFYLLLAFNPRDNWP